MEGRGTENKTLLDGVLYDQVLDVDVADGNPPLKMGFNIDDNAQASVGSWAGGFAQGWRGLELTGRAAC